MASRIGCNIVDPISDYLEGFYTLNAYQNLIRDYEQYKDYISALEFSHVTNITPQDAQQIGTLARKAGFTTWSIHSEHLNVGDRLEDYLKIQRHEAEVCAALGCQVMVCHLPNLKPYVDFNRDLDVIGKVAELTHHYGVKLAVETCGYPLDEHAFLPDADLVIQVVEALNLPDVGINLDAGHCLIGQTEKNPRKLEQILAGKEKQRLPEWTRRIGKNLFTTHLQDNFGLNDDHQAPGMGYIDWEQLIPAILDTGYQGPLIMELTGPSCKANRTVEQLRNYPLDREIVGAASYLSFLVKKVEADRA